MLFTKKYLPVIITPPKHILTFNIDFHDIYLLLPQYNGSKKCQLPSIVVYNIITNAYILNRREYSYILAEALFILAAISLHCFTH